MPNPFQDNSPPSSKTRTAPVAADTIASRSSSSSSSHRNCDAASQHQQEDQEQDQEDEGDRTKDDISMRENPLIHLTRSQREAAVENLEIETMDRIQKLRASIGVLAGSLRFRADLELNRLPTSIRSMTVEEFWFKYNGNAKEYLKLQTKVKTEANTSFLHAIGMDRKRNREGSESAKDQWEQSQRGKDDTVNGAGENTGVC
ncbi:hypothetical protein BG006_006873 [Podila minutissima]|uniref:Borealin N-terminal domain-containing protein n=1 Tax=Podila minutissima TaxID=64525 RepID=A0A9P5VLA6_9FUNG|nr:hypothetical protein BG006_006873 [Podila minutissima]